MSYMLFYLVCVMISPLKIWFLIKKNTFLVNGLFQFISVFQDKSEVVNTSWQHRGVGQKRSKKTVGSHVCWFVPC